LRIIFFIANCECQHIIAELALQKCHGVVTRSEDQALMRKVTKDCAVAGSGKLGG